MFNLKNLRKELGLKRSDLSKAIGIHQSTLANYENEIRQAPYETLILLADYFHISIDELLGRDNLFTPITEKPQLSEKEKTLIKCYQSLSDKDKARLEDYLLLLTSNR